MRGGSGGKRIAEAILERSPSAKIRVGAPMSEYTGFQVGGEADALLLAASAGEAILAREAAEAAGFAVYWIGRGTNLIVRGGGIRGLVIRIGPPMDAVRIDGETVRAEAGASLRSLCEAAQAAGLTGLEFACGIPGSVGGAVAMNAGAYGGEMRDSLSRALVYGRGEPSWRAMEALGFGYRTSGPLREGELILEAEFELARGDPEAIRNRMEGYDRARAEKQPIDLPSAGSTFKRPEGHFAGALIEGCGLRGLRVGGARVSEKHAGFIVNAGGATAGDVLALIEAVRSRVLSETGVLLEPEVRIIGED